MKRILLGAAVAAFAMPAFADSEITITDAYARAAGMNAMAGAAFFVIENTGDEDDRLIGASSDIAARVELHTHIEGEDGVMQMRQVEDGFPVAAGSTHVLERGSDHVMFMGLNGSMAQGDTVKVTLMFEKAGEIEVEIPVDLERQPNMGGSHGNMGSH
ncbi:MAG: copper chaperone PCu(A)C [Pseudomonadota bacterium]|nr:copper chaperone PCu(A)C [Pseudomonadota bacterium]